MTKVQTTLVLLLGVLSLFWWIQARNSLWTTICLSYYCLAFGFILPTMSYGMLEYWYTTFNVYNSSAVVAIFWAEISPSVFCFSDVWYLSFYCVEVDCCWIDTINVIRLVTWFKLEFGANCIVVTKDTT